MPRTVATLQTDGAHGAMTRFPSGVGNHEALQQLKIELGLITAYSYSLRMMGSTVGGATDIH